MTDVKTRTYQGGTLEELLPQIRDELGDDAIVVRQREGLKGGVGGFFQKRCVEVEARAGAVAPPRGFSVTDGPDVAPPGVPPATPEPAAAPAPVAPAASIAEAMLAQAGAAGFGARLADAQAEQDAFGAVAPEPEPAPAPTVGAALTVDDILGGAAPAPAPAPAVEPAPAPAAAAAQPEAAPVEPPTAPRARGRIVTSPQVDAIPTAAAPEPVPAPVVPQPVVVPPPVVPAAGVPARAARAERVVEQLADRGLTRAFAEGIVDDTMALRVPLQPGARLSTVVSRELAQRIPVAPLAHPGVSAWVGAGGAGKTSAIAALARAHAEHGGLRVACVSVQTPDRGATLRAALEGAPVDVYAPVDDAEAVALVGQLTAAGLTVFVDTPAVSPRNAAEVKALGRRLKRLGVQEVHLCIPATLGLDVARDVVEAASALKPAGMTITHGDETDRLGAAVQLAIDAGLPVSFVHEGGSTGRGLRAADPVELAKALIG